MTSEDLKIPEEIIEAQEMFEKHFMGPQDNDCDHESEDLKHAFNGFMMGYLCAKEYEKGKFLRELKARGYGDGAREVKINDKDCNHEFLCADNSAVSGAEICVKCWQVRAKSD